MPHNWKDFMKHIHQECATLYPPYAIGCRCTSAYCRYSYISKGTILTIEIPHQKGKAEEATAVIQN